MSSAPPTYGNEVSHNSQPYDSNAIQPVQAPAAQSYPNEKTAPVTTQQQHYGQTTAYDAPQQQQYTQPQPQQQQQQQQYTEYKGPAQIQQQQVAHQPPASNFTYATPLASLQSSPAPIDCPFCHTRQMTRVEMHSGGTTHAIAAGLCICFCLGCIPYCISGTKDAEHHCGNCGRLVATWHRSGRTEVLAH